LEAKAEELCDNIRLQNPVAISFTSEQLSSALHLLARVIKRELDTVASQDDDL
jgi:hypothetical protein